jgi:hypothetical protein
VGRVFVVPTLLVFTCLFPPTGATYGHPLMPCTVRSDWLTPYYFSTVTFTPGFGDISAKTWVGEFVAMREVISGYTTLGLLRSVRADKKERQNSCQPFARFECALSHACLGFAFV